MNSLALTLYFLSVVYSIAGVYDTLEFGDDRKTVVSKLEKSKLVEPPKDNTFFGRTSLNGIYKCKTPLAGLTYHLYFSWNEDGGLNEITLHSNTIPRTQYDNKLLKAWEKTTDFFSQVYNTPAQKAKYPPLKSFNQPNILLTHIWHKGEKQSILVGPGLRNKDEFFLIIRFINQHLKPVIIPSDNL